MSILRGQTPGEITGEVTDSIYPAEFGRNIGQVNVSTKAGTNAYHGTLFDFFRNFKMDANDFGFTSVAPVRRGERPRQPAAQARRK
ncbi:MAG TPA: hypothetical protein VEU62_21270 [Bryobacterales bacterium]|nr:hypothetical protein [Bryobacterales bacterium]